MASFSALLGDLVSNFESAENPTHFLRSKLIERAHSISTHTSTDDKHKPHHGIGFPQICADESDVDVSEMDWVPQPADASLNDDSSRAVDELLPLVKKENVFGRQAEKERLLSRLLSADPRRPQLSVIPIFGRDGIGKTTLARQIYEDPTVQDHFELKAWVKIDGQQRNHHQLFDIARQLLKSAMGMLCSFNNLVEMHEMVVDTLLSHRSLIVLDDFDLMEEELWRHLKDSWFRFVGVGSKVVITSRDRRVDGATVPFYLEQLSPRDSWSLYSSLAFSLSRSRDHEREDDDAIAIIVKRLAERCQGVPLSLKLLGSLMRFQGSFFSSNFKERISAASSSDHDDSLILVISVLSLPNDLFNCFAFCGIFPYGYVLEKEKLNKMWMANDVVKNEEIGEDYFHQLLCRSFFTDVTCNEYGEIVQAQMPKAIHGVAQILARVVYSDKVAYSFGVDGDSVRLSMPMAMAVPFDQKFHFNPKHLQTLVSFPPKTTPHLLPIKNPSFMELKRLRSLDLSKSGIRSLSRYICMLRKLRYLNLSHTLLTKLPKSFTTLTRLQNLDLSRCYYLKALPKKISNLSKLRHLDLSHCNSLSRTPLGIGRMHSLITMPLYVLNERDSKCATLGELRSLKNLRGVLHITNLENVKEIDEAGAADLKQKKLHHLRLSWSHKEEECGKVLEFLEPNPQLRVLELSGYGDHEFPPWMPNLHSLVKLLINDCSCRTLPKLGELRLLKELELKEMINVTSIGQECYGNGGTDDLFPSLEKLKLHGMPILSTWFKPKGTNNHHSSSRKLFPTLKKLSIQGCPELQTLPSLPSVTELVVGKSHGQIVPSFTKIGSPSSIVMNDMDVKESLEGSSSSKSVKKLILLRSTDLDVLESSHISKFASLQHLRVLHCLKLDYVTFGHDLGSLEKLDVVDCQNLKRIDIITEDFTLTELMIEDCPQITTIDITTYNGSPSSLRKLVVRNCPKFSISPEKIKELQGLEFLFFTGCPKMR